KKAAPAKKVVAKKPLVKKAAPVKKTTLNKPVVKAEPKAPPAPKLPPPPPRCEYSNVLISDVKTQLGDKAKRPLTPKQFESLRVKLIEERALLVHQADELQAEADALMMERELGDTQFDEESGEGDTIAIERERDLLISAKARETVEEIDRALARMDAGTYGVCVPSGVRIPFERLDAMPFAEACVFCRNRVERHR
ncbi:MAG: TraR/DksA C4-type zinc finger protein, partial [Actinomycetes bacterium]